MLKKSLFLLDTKNHDWPQIYSIFIIGLSALACSTLFSWPSPTRYSLLSNSSYIKEVTLEETSYFAVIPPLITVVILPLAAILLDTVGRRNVIMLAIIPLIISWILIAFGNTVEVLYISRVFYGIGDTVLFIIPTYIGEISTPKVRGTWGNLTISFWCFGVFLINVVGSYCHIKSTALIFLVISIVNMLLFVIVPESPYFLLMKGIIQKAEQSVKMLRWNKNVQDKLLVLAEDVKRQSTNLGTFKDLWIIPVNRKALLIALTLRLSQNFSGFAVFPIYSQYIFSIAGGCLSPASSSIIYSFALFMLSFAFSFTADKFGRRLSMIFSSFGCAIALFIKAIYFYLMNKTDVELSLGILPTLMLGELFSTSIKSKAMGVYIIFNSLCVFCEPKLFQFLASTFGMHVPFFLFGCCTSLSIVFSYFCVPETKMKTLEEIQQMLL